MSYSKYLDIIDDPEIIKKEAPKLFNHTVNNCKFEVRLTSKNNYYERNKFSDKVEKPVEFEISEVSVPKNNEKLFVRCMIVDPKFPENPIVCKNHGNADEEKGAHILRSTSNDGSYVGTKDGVYPEERLGVLIPIEDRKTFSLHFMCFNMCYLARDRKYAGLVMILENENGDMLARRFFKFAINVRPKRSGLQYDSESELNNLHKKTKRNTLVEPIGL